MSRRPPSQPQESKREEVYKMVHQAQSTQSQGIEWYDTQILVKDQLIQQQQGIIDDLQKRVSELQPNLKKVPNNTETKK